MTWRGRLRARFRGFGGRALAGHARKPDPEAARTDRRAVDLPVRVPAMDARFRRICAVFADGRCLIAEGYEPDDRLRLDLVALRQSGAIPTVLTEESVPLEEDRRALARGRDTRAGKRRRHGRRRGIGAAPALPAGGRGGGARERRRLRAGPGRLQGFLHRPTTASCRSRRR